MSNALFISGTVLVMLAYRIVMGVIFQQADIEGSVIQWIVQQAGLGGIAALSLIMLNKVWKDRVEAEKTHAQDLNTIRAETLAALRENTTINARLCERMEQKQ